MPETMPPPPIPVPLSIGEYRYPREGGALGLAMALLLLITLVVMAISVFIAAVFVALGLVYIKLRQRSLLGNSIPVTHRSYPKIYDLLHAASGSLSMPMPRTHVIQDPTLNAFSIGFSAPYSIVLNSALIDSTDPQELLFILGHESGHVLAGHTTWLSFIAPLGRTIPGFDFLFGFWQRLTEYTADRTGLLVVRDLRAAMRALVKVHCGPKALEHMDLQEALQQIATFDEKDLASRLGEMLGTHPYLVNRIRELIIFDRQHGISGVAQPKSCVFCGSPAGTAARFCSVCGSPLICLECGGAIGARDDRFCRNCGNSLEPLSRGF